MLNMIGRDMAKAPTRAKKRRVNKRKITKVRNKVIALAVLNGATYSDMADQYLISETRVSSICAAQFRKLGTGLMYSVQHFRNPMIRIPLMTQLMTPE